jgi:hypothetical protein
MVTLLGSGVWSASAGVGDMTPESKVMMLKDEIRKRFHGSLLMFIDISPLELVCDWAKKHGESGVVFSLY